MHLRAIILLVIRLRLPRIYLFQYFLKSVNFAATLWSPDPLDVQRANLVCKHKIDDVGLTRLQLCILNNQFKCLRWLQLGTVGHQISQAGGCTARILRVKQLLSAQVHHVWDELVSVEVSSLVSFTGIFVLFFVFVLFLNHLCELLNDVDVRLEPLIDSDLYILMLRGEHTLH